MRTAQFGSTSDRVMMTIAAIFFVVLLGPTMCTVLNPAPVGRTIGGVKHRLDHDLPKGTSADSAIAYMKRTGARYFVGDRPLEILGREEGVLPAGWPYQGNLIFRIFFDDANRVRGDTVYEEVIGM